MEIVRTSNCIFWFGLTRNMASQEMLLGHTGLRIQRTFKSPEMLRDKHYRRFCGGLGTYIRFLSTVDDLVLVIKGLLGESHMVAWERESEA